MRSGRSLLARRFLLALPACFGCARSSLVDLPLWHAEIDPTGREVRVVQLPYEQLSYDMKTFALVRQVRDTNQDGVSDQIVSWDGAGGARSEETDSDFDGQVDRWETFGTTGQRMKTATSKLGGKPDQVALYDPSGALRQVDSDTDLDGVVDTTRLYEAGRVVEVRIDSDRSGRPDRIQDFRPGYLAHEEFDTNEDGKPDLRMSYSESGALLKAEIVRDRNRAR